jgi:type VI secretion system secreted protein VgrG
MPDWSRDKAMLTMTSPLGANALIPIGLSAQEAISSPFQFDVTVVSVQGTFDPDKLLNQPVCVTLQDRDATPLRYFHGIVQHLAAGATVRGQTGTTGVMYQLRLVPKLWFLSQTTDCRVYQNLSTADILQKLFTDVQLTDQQVIPSGAKREYTVQFNETDLHFATRLMEEEGYFYFFEHTASAHKLIVANQNTAFPEIPEASLHITGSGGDNTLITDWRRPTATARGKMKLKDYDPTKPDTKLEQESPTTLKAGGAPQRDGFRWPAATFQNSTVTDRTKWEMEAAEAAVSLFEGSSQFGKLVAGGKFSIATKPSAGSYDGTYALRSVSHHASDDTWLNRGGGSSYANNFACFQTKVNWRQPIATPRPRMDGIHSALVLGPAGEEIYTDDLARVKVQFYWDHRQEASADQACWARVVQPWAGNGWGGQFIPRVGTEVAVAFVDGDPDRPIVIGGLYNGTQKPIYAVGDKTKSGFRSRSSLKGGTSDFNEFTFDDKDGNELVFLHAQKDLTTEVEHDQTLTVDNCRVVTVKKDETVEIKNNQKITVTQDQTITVSQGNRSVTISQGNDSLTISTGNLSIKASTGKIAVNAMQEIELTVGGNSLKIDQTGVSITGTMVKIAGQAMLDMKAPMSTLKGDGMLTLKGGLVLIN